MIDKPPYKVPSMVEIKNIPWNGFNVVSTFSGTGGSCLGYRMAGYRVLWANEFIPKAQECYKANHPNSILDKRDIRTVQPQDILDATGLSVGDIDIFDGSPPCSAFSTAGKREKGWGSVKKYSDTTQRVDDLFFEYARLVKGTQPKVFVAENVSGLVKGTAKGYFLEILSALKDCGYNVRCKVLDAQYLGVPQMRQRTIFVGVRDDIPIEPCHPKPLPYRYSVRDALPFVIEAVQDPKGLFDVQRRGDRPSFTIKAQSSSHCHVEAIKQITHFEMGRGFGTFAKVSADSGPYQTVGTTPSSGNGLARSVFVGMEKRKFTIAELKQICAFPADFILTGSYAQQWERLGRAVPPVMMSHIAKTIETNILTKL